MKVNQISIVLITAIIFFFSSCTKEEINITTITKEDLIGTWRLTSISGGKTTKIPKTPESTGKESIVKITEDRFQWRTNDSLVVNIGYEIITAWSDISKDSVLQIKVGDMRAQTIILENPDQLLLIDELFDGTVAAFERQKQ